MISFIIVFIIYLLRPGVSTPIVPACCAPFFLIPRSKGACTVPSSVSPHHRRPPGTPKAEVQIDTIKSAACFGSASKLVRSEYFLMGGLPDVLGQHFYSPIHFLLLLQQLQVARKMRWLSHVGSDVSGHATLLLFLYQPGSFEQGSYIQ